jgi:hypothetical protein
VATEVNAGGEGSDILSVPSQTSERDVYVLDSAAGHIGVRLFAGGESGILFAGAVSEDLVWERMALQAEAEGFSALVLPASADSGEAFVVASASLLRKLGVSRLLLVSLGAGLAIATEATSQHAFAGLVTITPGALPVGGDAKTLRRWKKLRIPKMVISNRDGECDPLLQTLIEGAIGPTLTQYFPTSARDEELVSGPMGPLIAESITTFAVRTCGLYASASQSTASGKGDRL